MLESGPIGMYQNECFASTESNRMREPTEPNKVLLLLLL